MNDNNVDEDFGDIRRHNLQEGRVVRNRVIQNLGRVLYLGPVFTLQGVSSVFELSRSVC